MDNFKIKSKRLLSIQDISCFGKCSLTVALPIISACGIETDIIPSAVLSTHTGGFCNYTFRDLTEDIPLISKHWEKEGIFFDAIYSGYLGNRKQILYVSDIMDNLLYRGGLKIVDPVMADNGKLYKGFDMDYVKAMKKLCEKADIVSPNITEACLLADIEYKEIYDEDYINFILDRLSKLTKATIILKGIKINNDIIKVAIKKGEKVTSQALRENITYISAKYIDVSCNGSGAMFISALVGAYLSGVDMERAVKLAMDFVVKSIENTLKDKGHCYGVKFEENLKEFINKIEK